MKLSKTKAMIKAVITFFSRSNGILLLHKCDIPNDVNDYYLEIISDLEMKGSSEDRKNMRSDGVNLKNDIKKSVAAYRSEVCNG